tara:strand:- start:4 stop:141 length:138 start_codon:yes stop_codon:yes gene_type:complete
MDKSENIGMLEMHTMVRRKIELKGMEFITKYGVDFNGKGRVYRIC